MIKMTRPVKDLYVLPIYLFKNTPAIRQRQPFAQSVSYPWYRDLSFSSVRNRSIPRTCTCSPAPPPFPSGFEHVKWRPRSPMSEGG